MRFYQIYWNPYKSTRTPNNTQNRKGSQLLQDERKLLACPLRLLRMKKLASCWQGPHCIFGIILEYLCTVQDLGISDSNESYIDRLSSHIDGHLDEPARVSLMPSFEFEMPVTGLMIVQEQDDRLKEVLCGEGLPQSNEFLIHLGLLFPMTFRKFPGHF